MLPGVTLSTTRFAIVASPGCSQSFGNGTDHMTTV